MRHQKHYVRFWSYVNYPSAYDFSDPDDQEGPIDLSRRDLVVVSRDPKQDHNYSSTPVPPCPRQMPPSQPVNFSLSLHHDQERGSLARWPRSPLQGPLLEKRSRRDSRSDVDEELKEAAGSLLHLAGIRTNLVASRRKSRKLSRKWTRFCNSILWPAQPLSSGLVYLPSSL